MQYIIGYKIHKWTLVGLASPRSRKKYWLCRCDCGLEREVREDALKNNMSKSCGHSGVKQKHGACINYTTKPEYYIWDAMLQRCTNKKHRLYARYGGRGIAACKEWKKYANFIKDMGDRPSKKHSLDRINNDGNYEPSNCRWTNRKVQSRNTSRTRFILLHGEKVKFIEACEQYNIDYNTVKSRIRSGWSPEKALTTPVKIYKNKKRI